MSRDAILTHDDIAAAIGDKLEELKPLAPLLVATNIVGEAFTYALGLVTGLLGLVSALLRGISKVSFDQGDAIADRLTKGARISARRMEKSREAERSASPFSEDPQQTHLGQNPPPSL